MIKKTTTEYPTFFGIIYWVENDDSKKYFVRNEDGTIWQTDQLEVADAKANKIEELLGRAEMGCCRVISLEGVGY